MKRIALTLIILFTAIVSASASEDGVLRILAIGNSFSEDALEQEFYPIAQAGGVKVIVGNMYIAGCSIDRHVKNIKGDIAEYAYRKIGLDGIRNETKGVRLITALADEQWDYISVQQASGFSGIPESYSQLGFLVDWIRSVAPTAKVVFHQTWAYSANSTHNDFARYDKDQRKMHNAIISASTRAASDAGINILIPVGKAIQSVRGALPDTELTRDGFHLDRRYGRYIAAATWYEVLSGKSIQDNAYVPEGVTEQEIKVAKNAIKSAAHGFMGDTTPKTLTPKTKSGMYKGHKNYGKSIAVFGGSLSVNKESDAAKQIWADELHSTVTTYGVGGAGFAAQQGYTLQQQVRDAGIHDIYVLWASTNDFTNSQPIGSWSDYTVDDGYNEEHLHTQCGGINYCIKTLLEKNPAAEIYFFTSFRFFSMEAGYNPFSTNGNATGHNFSEYVQGQKDCCSHFSIPVLDQFELLGANEYNYQLYYVKDKLHLNEDGYRKMGPVQAAFLADGK